MADAAARRRRVMAVAAALVAIFLFRLLYGLSREFFLEDETQIFLMGLRYYATGAWPFFGADVVWTNSEIPGALQALLVGVPFKIIAIPEAPFALLNVLSMAALAAFAWYVTARLPQLPKWLVWIWLMTLPWTLEFSTHIVNPSYLLAASLVFFIGFFEAMPVFRLGKIPEQAAFAFMGAAIAWAFQIHMSWPLLLPYAVLAWFFAWRQGIRTVAANTAALLGGGLLIGALLIPTFVVFGLHGGAGGTLRNMRPHWVSLMRRCRCSRACFRSLASRSGVFLRRMIPSGRPSCCVICGSRRSRRSYGWPASGSPSGCFANGFAHAPASPSGRHSSG